MEPLHLYALHQLNAGPDLHRERLARYFVERDRARAARRARVHRWRRWLLGHGSPKPAKVELAVG